MNYTELTGQESGIWIYKASNEAVVCNWGSSGCEGNMPTIFAGNLVWFPINDNGEKYEYEWEKTHEDVKLKDWLDDITVVYDDNNDMDADDVDSWTGDVYETEDFVILTPKGWN